MKLHVVGYGDGYNVWKYGLLLIWVAKRTGVIEVSGYDKRFKNLYQAIKFCKENQKDKNDD